MTSNSGSHFTICEYDIYCTVNIAISANFLRYGNIYCTVNIIMEPNIIEHRRSEQQLIDEFLKNLEELPDVHAKIACQAAYVG